MHLPGGVQRARRAPAGRGTSSSPLSEPREATVTPSAVQFRCGKQFRNASCGGLANKRRQRAYGQADATDRRGCGYVVGPLRRKRIVLTGDYVRTASDLTVPFPPLSEVHDMVRTLALGVMVTPTQASSLPGSGTLTSLVWRKPDAGCGGVPRPRATVVGKSVATNTIRL